MNKQSGAIAALLAATAVGPSIAADASLVEPNTAFRGLWGVSDSAYLQAQPAVRNAVPELLPPAAP